MYTRTVLSGPVLLRGADMLMMLGVCMGRGGEVLLKDPGPLTGVWTTSS